MKWERRKKEAGEWVNKIHLRQRKKTFIPLIHPGSMGPEGQKWVQTPALFLLRGEGRRSLRWKEE